MRITMKYLTALLSLCALPAFATVDITGSVAAKCVIQADKAGVPEREITSKAVKKQLNRNRNRNKTRTRQTQEQEQQEEK